MACVLLTLAVIIAGTPQGRAAAQGLLRFFVRTNRETIALPTSESILARLSSATVETQSPLETGLDCGTVLAPRCSLSQVQEIAGFPAHALVLSGENLQFAGAALTGQGGVVLVYQGKDGVLNLAQIPARQDEVQKWRIGPNTTVESVAIGDVQGGGFGMGMEEGTTSWEDLEAMQTLRWEKGGVQYTLWFTAAKTASGFPALSQSDLVRLAASLVIPAEQPDTADLPGLNPQQASDQAGFPIVQPQSAPTGFKHSNTAYSSQYNSVCLFYSYQPYGVSPTLVLFQSNWALPPIDDFLTRAVYNGQPVEIASESENLPLAGVAGETAILVTTGLNTGRICNDVQAQVNRALLWQANGRSYILFAALDQLDGRGYLSKVEIRRLAESLIGAERSAAAEIDPERLASIEQAEAISGVDLKFSALMLDGLHLDHFAYQNYGPYQGSTGESMVAMLFTGSPVGDGRAYKIMIMQTWNPENSLEVMALAGGYEAALVMGQPAIYRQDCWEAFEDGPRAGCQQHLAWFDGNTRFEIETFLPASLPKESLIEIAESMQ